MILDFKNSGWEKMSKTMEVKLASSVFDECLFAYDEKYAYILRKAETKTHVIFKDEFWFSNNMFEPTDFNFLGEHTLVNQYQFGVHHDTPCNYEKYKASAEIKVYDAQVKGNREDAEIEVTRLLIELADIEIEHTGWPQYIAETPLRKFIVANGKQIVIFTNEENNVVYGVAFLMETSKGFHLLKVIHSFDKPYLHLNLTATAIDYARLRGKDISIGSDKEYSIFEPFIFNKPYAKIRKVT